MLIGTLFNNRNISCCCNMIAQVINNRIDPRMKYDRGEGDWDNNTISDFEIVGENYISQEYKSSKRKKF